MTTSRLIEHWLPIAALGEESVRERRSMTALPPTYYLHVWWARRPLVASRAAVLGSLLPADADQEQFMRVLGIHGDPVKTRARIDVAKRTGEDLGLDPYGYERAFKYAPTDSEKVWVKSEAKKLGLTFPSVLDPTAGGGSIPFESVRLGLPTYGNDLNPVAVLIQRATYDWPVRYGDTVRTRFVEIAKRFIELAEPRFVGVFPAEPEGTQVLGYLWARTIICPHCDGMVPLSPNWKLAGDGTGVRVKPDTTTRRCKFEIVDSTKQQSKGTVKGGDGLCPYSDCGRPIEGDHIKAEAQAGRMGEQLYAIAFKRRALKTTKAGRKTEGWERGYRAPTAEDDVSALIAQRLAEKMPLWDAEDLIPNERIPEGLKTEEPRRYGMHTWRDLFSQRQLLGHVTGVEIYHEMVEQERAAGRLDELTRAAFGYLALSLDKLRDYNSRMARWHSNRGVMVNTFDRHDFAFKWSYAEMAPLIVGLGFDWVIAQTTKCIGELIALVRPGASSGKKSRKASELDQRMGGGLFVAEGAPSYSTQTIELSCKSGEALDHIGDGNIDCVVMDPPYYDNVMYAELSDFFYVWLKRTAGRVYPELFRRQLTDKDSEAVANPARFRGEKGAKALAGRDYQQRMAAIFAECRRVLKPDGIMTLMFTHKATGAWDALTKGLMEAGFTISASWPINTESESSLHIKDKAAANSTIFLVCRPRPPKAADDALYWEDVEPTLAAEVRKRVAGFQKAGIRGVDLYLASFGPALEEFSKHWPLRRGRPRPQPEQTRRNRQAALFQEESDPYEATPEDALEAARREVKDWRLKQLVQQNTRAELDPTTAWFVLAWDSFGAPEFPYDEALMLARAVGVDLERDIVGKLAEKKANNLHLLDSAARVAKGRAGAADGSSSMLDVLHHAAQRARSRGAAAALELLQHNGLDSDPKFLLALEALLEVLPVPPGLRGESGEAEDHAGDFDALEKLRRLAFADQIGQPEQLRMFEEQQRALEVAW
jgi:putative DNA methylase